MNANQKRLVTLEGDNPASRISGLIEMRHCLQKDVALAIGMSEQVFSNKMNGLRSFSAKDYKALADFFNTSVDYLMGRTLDPWPVDNPTPNRKRRRHEHVLLRPRWPRRDHSPESGDSVLPFESGADQGSRSSRSIPSICEANCS